MSDARRSLTRLVPVPGDSPSQRLDVIRERLDALMDPDFRAGLFADGVEESEFSPPMLDVGLALQARRVAPGPLQRALEQHPPRTTRPGGRACVISAGNVPLVTASDIVWSLLAGDRVVVKLSHRERAMTRAFVALFADHVVADRWARDDEATERAVFGWADHVYAYGSDAAIASIGARRTGAMQGFGHRVSFGWVSTAAIDAADEFDLADRIATDVAMWDQEGCLSPHAVLVTGDGAAKAAKAAGELAERLASALARLEGVVPRGAVSFETRSASRALTLATEARMLSRSDIGTWNGDAGAWSVLLDPEPDTLLSPLGRTIRIVPLSGSDAVEAALAPFRGRVQSLGVGGSFGFDADPDAVAIARSIGATRVCSLGRMQQPTASWFGEELPSSGVPPSIDVDTDPDDPDDAWRWLRGEEAPPWFRMPS
jgi:hypothetical protein